MFTPISYFKIKFGSQNVEKCEVFFTEYDKFVKQYKLKNMISLEYLNSRLTNLNMSEQIIVDKDEYQTIHKILLENSIIDLLHFSRQKIDEYLFNETALRLGWIILTSN